MSDMENEMVHHFYIINRTYKMIMTLKMMFLRRIYKNNMQYIVKIDVRIFLSDQTKDQRANTEDQKAQNINWKDGNNN